MAFKGYKRFRGRRRGIKKYTRSTRGTLSRRNFIPTILPTGITTRVKYAEWLDLTMGNGVSGTTPAIFAFSTNSIQDPNVTGAGHQPMGHDQLAALYGRYTVLGSKIKIHAHNASTSTGAIIGCFVTNSSTLGAQSVANLIEEKASKVSNKVLSLLTGGHPTSYLTDTWSLRKEIKGAKGVGDVYSAAIGSSPSVQNYFLVWMGPMDASNTTHKVQFYVEVDYIVRWFDPIQLTQS